MNDVVESDVSQAILDAYHAKFRRALQSDVVIVGAGASGLVSAYRLAGAGHRVVLIEKRLSPGGGIWGGSIGMNEVVVQADALHVLDEIGVRYTACGRLFTADAAALACALCAKAIEAGAVYLNLMSAEDLCVREGRVTGVVANRSMIGERLPVDPIVLSARAVIDATGHEAALVACLCRRNLLENRQSRIPGEGLMNALAGEQFVVARAAEVYPGLWITGMSVCAALGGPRMGPIFGGMLLSGAKVAEQVAKSLVRRAQKAGYG